jgi:excisionase family DNA binding protein
MSTQNAPAGLAPAALNSKAAANYLGISLRKLQIEVAAGNLIGRRAGRLLLFRRRELDAWLAALPAAKPTDVHVPRVSRVNTPNKKRRSPRQAPPHVSPPRRERECMSDNRKRAAGPPAADPPLEAVAAELYRRRSVVDADGNQRIEPYQDVRIETRGQGGYVVAPGSPLSVHRSGQPYVQVLGPPLALVECGSRKLLLGRCDCEIPRASYLVSVLADRTLLEPEPVIHWQVSVVAPRLVLLWDSRPEASDGMAEAIAGQFGTARAAAAEPVVAVLVEADDAEDAARMLRPQYAQASAESEPENPFSVREATLR